MAHEAEFSLSYADDERARLVERSLSPEVAAIGGARTRTRLDRTGDELTISITASDLVALRAGLNTWLSLVGVAERAGGVSPADAAAPGFGT